ncbi:lyase family protein [Actinokineospora sp. NBRC 105648]|uniref:lyase family protein n=1 Tax=Actinokineospora sp. NBRC 105648 TaxID=3032206 RepID=UPI00249FCA18|nr:lyase family protein [Actinokineospora sp. NBRC 105648]GLZ41097.1 argininosuccinate lyase [Actinokineospora sp. NBRC 105648]
MAALSGLGPRTRRVVYGALPPEEVAAELAFTARVDRAHLVMLVERGLVDPDAARALLKLITELTETEFAALAGRPAPRGVYLMYEGYLIERLGADVGGVLHTGRSRNDLKATTTALDLRAWSLDFVEQVARLQGVLLSRARAHRAVVMPVHTHFQAAMPITYGYYLLGVAHAVGRELRSFRAAVSELDTCPLGAAAVAGTDLPIDPARTAALLGFSGTTSHALDSLASRDTPLRLLAAAASLAVVLSRAATDLQLWSSAEFGFVTFPDRLVGGSSAMPQKRNAFLLEHVRAKAGRAIGSWAGAAATVKSAPFTNSIEVGTESVAEIRAGLAATAESVALCQVLLAGAVPVPGRMAERVATGFTAATSIANRLVRSGTAFRTAHEVVGDAVRAAVASGSSELPGLDEGRTPAELVEAQRYGGGPGAFDLPFDQALADWSAHREWCRAKHSALDDAASALDEATRTAALAAGS